MSSFRLNGFKLLVSISVIIIAAFSAEAQTITGTISGTVTDPNGGVIPGANVTLTYLQTGATRNAVTNEEGRFMFSAVQPGTYSVKIERQGFQSLLRENTVLAANENLALGELALTAGNVTETVTVTSAGATVETQSSDLTARLTSDQISLIATKGRDVTSLLRLLPGTSNNDDIEGVGEGFGTDLPNISGQRGRSTVSTVDGLNGSEPSGSNKLSLTINQDAVAEVQVLRNNYAAEYGNNGGAIINIVSKGGGSNYRGSAYYYIRNEALNANNFFNNKSNLPRALYRHNIWGFNAGGPLPLLRFGETDKMFIKNKAFFFFSYEKPRQITPTDPVSVTVPTALERQGNFSQSRSTSGAVTLTDPLGAPGPLNPFPIVNNIIPSQRFNSSGLALLNYYPLPNAGTAANPGLYSFQKSVDVRKRSMVIRFDVKPTKNDNIYWKRQWWTSDNEGLGTSGWPNGATGRDRWGISSHYLYKDNGWSTNWVHIFSSKVVNEFNFGMRHDSEGFIPSAGIVEGLQRSALNYTSPQLFPTNNHLGTIPRATGWTSVQGNPANINWLDRWGETGNDYIEPAFADNITFAQGDHTLKFGAYFERVRNGEAPGGQWSGVFDFGIGNSTTFPTGAGNTGFAYSNALLGNFLTYTETSARPFTNLELKLFQWYAQDQWKVNRRLTVNYGMRFGWHSPFFQVDQQGSNFDARLWDPANAPLLYVPYCMGQPGGVPPLGTACVASTNPITNRSFAVDPRVVANGGVPTAAQLLPSRYVRSFVQGVGNRNNGLAIGTDPNTPQGYRTTRSIDMEPRVGFAWDISGKGKTVIRAMGGMYHAPRVGGGTTGGNLVNNPPANRSFQLGPGNIDSIAGLVGSELNFPTALNSVEVQSHTPVSYNFSAGVQQDIGFDTVVEVSYVGTFGRWLGERRNLNGVPDGARFVNCPTLPSGITCHPENRDPLTASSNLNNDFLRPYRGFADINQVTWGGTSKYNSLQVQVNRRYTAHLQYGVAYTYSKSMDYANDDSSDVNNPRPYKAFNYAVSDFDQPHILTINYIWDVPRLSKVWNNGFIKAIFDKWQVSGTTSYASGKPKNLSYTFSGTTINISPGNACPSGTIQGSPITGTGTTAGLIPCTPITDYTGGQENARAFLTCDPLQGASGTDGSGTPYVFNVNCFAKPTALGQIGDAGRNNVRLPSIFNNDLAFFKNFHWGEKRNVRLRWEVYNIFNRANFRDMDVALTYGLVLSQSGTGTCNRPLAPTTNNCTTSFTQTRSTFGTPTSARAPRIMQASIQIDF
jgi:hypothetical protein